jgi:hypothetical protein
LRGYFRERGVNVWVQAIGCGAAFFGVFFATQWLFADFLVSPAAANPFFGTIYRDYGTPATSLEGRGVFFGREANFVSLLVWAVAISMAASRIGLGWGNWMRTVKR